MDNDYQSTCADGHMPPWVTDGRGGTGRTQTDNNGAAVGTCMRSWIEYVCAQGQDMAKVKGHLTCGCI